ncbi:MAG: histone deacetylase family protein [Methylocystaceae bacterium]|nr:histone deacetylase family protein [Methylocystaceae bacterium]
MKVVLNPQFGSHDVQTEIHQGKMVPSFENPSRLKHILDHFQAHPGHDLIDSNDYGIDPILKVHARGYVTFLQSIWADWCAEGRVGDIVPYIWPVPGLKRMDHENLNAKVGTFAFSSDTAIMAGTWEAAYQGAQSALTAFEMVRAGERAAFALTRPPGHHAHSASYGGYCFLNNAAIVAETAREQGYDKVCILDVDYHHGNGTQDIFYDRADVLTLSIHGHPDTNFPYFLGYEDECGEADGHGFNQNFPLKDGASFEDWCGAFNQAQVRIDHFQPDLLVVPLGVDTYEGDPISNFKLKSEDFLKMGQLLKSLNLPCMFVMEGGYDVAPLGQNVYNVIEGFDRS